MCARRLFEITACGTSVVTTPSAAVREYFAEDEIPASSRKQAENHLRSLVQSPELRDRMVHRAQRKIWDRHTYAHRAEAILEQLVPDKHRPLTTPRVSVLVPTVRPQQLEQDAWWTTKGRRNPVDPPDARVRSFHRRHGADA